MACFTYERNTKAPKLADTRCGTPGYYAPEVVTEDTSDKNYDAKRADVWSLGVILYQLLTLELPYPDKLYRNDGRSFVKAAHNKEWKKNFPKTIHLSSQVMNLLDSLLEPNPAKRIKSENIPIHPWLHWS